LCTRAYDLPSRTGGTFPLVTTTAESRRFFIGGDLKWIDPGEIGAG